MKNLLLAMICVGSLGLVLAPLPKAGEKPKNGVPDAQGWMNLFPNEKFTNWKRVPLHPDTKLSARNPWKVDRKNQILLCEGEDIKEMLRYQQPFGDGIFHVEWRFQKVPGKEYGYNSGVYVRSLADGKVWLQAQTAMLEKPPQVGDLFGDVLEDGKLKRILEQGNGTKAVHPVGQWNTFDIHCQGQTITVHLNGQPGWRGNWRNCSWLRGKRSTGIHSSHMIVPQNG